MSFKVEGKIKKILDKQEGTSKAGKKWVKQSFVVANNDGYEGREVVYCFEVFGEEKVDKFNKFNNEGDDVSVNFSINTNEYEGKYFTSLSSWSVFKKSESSGEEENQQASQETMVEADDLLPF